MSTSDFDTQHPRGDAGKFVAKAQSAPDLELAAPAEVSFDDLRDNHASLFRESEDAALDFIQTHAPKDTVRAVFTWSDQGNHLDLVAFDRADDSTISVGDVIWGDNEDGEDADMFEAMSNASWNVEAPFDRGLVTQKDNRNYLILEFAGRTAENISEEQLQDINERTRAAQAAVEVAAIDKLRALAPDGVVAFVLEQDDDDLPGSGLLITSVYSKPGTVLPDMNGDAWDEFYEYSLAIDASPSDAARDAGLTKRDSGFVLPVVPDADDRA